MTRVREPDFTAGVDHRTRRPPTASARERNGSRMDGSEIKSIWGSNEERCNV